MPEHFWVTYTLIHTLTHTHTQCTHLQILLRVPVAVEQDAGVSGLQVHAQAARACAQDVHKDVRVGLRTEVKNEHAKQIQTCLLPSDVKCTLDMQDDVMKMKMSWFVGVGHCSLLLALFFTLAPGACSNLQQGFQSPSFQ
eukprot:scaffold97219_cov22-Tisochrysis_lutea.AAC.1